MHAFFLIYFNILSLRRIEEGVYIMHSNVWLDELGVAFRRRYIQNIFL